MFAELRKDVLDLHALFEAGGNQPAARQQVLDVIRDLERAGLLESRGQDFYALTDQGKQAAAKLRAPGR